MRQWFQTEVILTALIEKTITRTLDERQKNLLNIISDNNEISKQQIVELKKEIVCGRRFTKHRESCKNV